MALVVFDSSQKSVVYAPLQRHIKVLASPGSGKSLVACYRVKYLIEQGISPNKILVTMFNEEAVPEFAMGLINADVISKPAIRTFHSLALRLINKLIKAGYLEEAQLVTNERKLHTIAKAALITAGCLAESKELDALVSNFYKFINLVKSTTQPPESFSHLAANHQLFTDAFYIYEKKRTACNLRSFKDLIYDTYYCIAKSTTIQRQVSNKISYIIIDEYQDINEITQGLISFLCGSNSYVMVVGDDDQTINQFQGSDPTFLINKFEDIYHDPLIFKLNTTYRYGHQVALLSGCAINENSNRTAKIAIPDINAPKTSISLGFYTKELTYPHMCYKQQGIIDAIEDWVFNKAGKYSDCAILLRTHSLTPQIELALVTNHISLSNKSSRSVINSYECRAVKSLLYVYNNRHDSPLDFDLYKAHLVTLFKTPYIHIKITIIDKLCTYIANSNGIDEAERIKQVNELTKKLPRISQRNLRQRAISIISLCSKEFDTFYELLKNYIDDSNIRTSLLASKKAAERSHNTLSIFDGFIELFRQHQKKPSDSEVVLDFLFDSFINNDTLGEQVKLLTIHASKGLTFPVVIVPGLIEGVFPLVNESEPSDLEAERRLYFVAITRVKFKLYLITGYDQTLIKKIKAHDNHVSEALIPNKRPPSRFIIESSFLAAASVGHAIEQNLKINISLNLPRKRWFNNYLTEIKSPLRIN